MHWEGGSEPMLGGPSDTLNINLVQSVNFLSFTKPLSMGNIGVSTT
jgi:hypothetical protein